MKSRIFLFLIIHTLFSCETVFGQITFQKTYGGTNSDYSYSIQQTADDGYIIAGITPGPTGNHFDVYLIKTNVYGDTLWTKIFGGADDQYGYSVQQTSDGGYIIAGYAESFPAAISQVYLIKTDANGDSLWTKTFGGVVFTCYGYSVGQTSDGGYIITGEFESSTFADVYLIKTDANGDLIWTKTLGGPYAEYGYCVEQTTDGGYIIVGTTLNPSLGWHYVYLIKTDTIGNLLWTKKFGGSNYQWGNSVQQTPDGGYIIAGYTYSLGAGDFDVYLIKTDPYGDTLWTKTYGGLDYDLGFSVDQTTDGGYIIAGRTQSFGTVGYDIYLIRTDPNGDSLWSRRFGGASVYANSTVQQTSDGGYIIEGNTFGANNYDIYLIKTDSIGNSGCNEASAASIITTLPIQVSSPATVVASPITIVSTTATTVGSGGIVTTLCTTTNLTPNPSPKERGVAIVPNPFSNEINVSIASNELSEIILYDITSRKLLQQTFINSTLINTSQLSKGIYIYEVRNEEELIAKGKVVKE